MRTEMTRVIALTAVLLGLTFVSREAVGQDVTLRIDAPREALVSGFEFDAAVLLDASVEGVDGWSFGVVHEPGNLELVSVAIGAAASTANNGGEPEFSALVTAESGEGFTFAAVLNLEDRAVVLPAADGQELATMRYLTAAPTEPCEAVAASIEFSDGIAVGDAPPVKTVVTMNSAGVPVATEGARVAIACPRGITITRCESDDEDVSLEWAISPDVVGEQLDFLFLYRNGEVVNALDIGTTSYVDEGLDAGAHQYTIVTFVFDEKSGDPVLVFGFCEATVTPVDLVSIDPPVGNWLGGETVTVSGTNFTTASATTIQLVGDGEELPLEDVRIVDESTLTATTPRATRLGAFGLSITNDRGTAEIADAFSYGFVRGQVTEDDSSDLTDAVAILAFLFAGGDEPACLDAADTNDDGVLNVTDGSALLDFLFKGGAAPAAPYPGAGADTTDDALGCLE